MTLIWFIVWVIADNVGGREPLLLNPVNAWAATLILAVALDLGAAHSRSGARSARSCDRPTPAHSADKASAP